MNKTKQNVNSKTVKCMDNGKNILPLKKETDAENFSCCVKACLHILMPLNFDILLFIVTNILILINVFVVICLVKFLKQFNYEKNEINDNLFVVIVLSIACYGVLSSLLCILTSKKWFLSGQFVNISVALFFLLALPFIIVLSNFIFSTNEIYLFTIQSNKTLTEIEYFTFHASSLPFSSKINYNDISWNINNENNSLTNKLCFSFDDSDHCAEKDKDLTIKIFLDKRNINKIERLQSIAQKSGYIYISNARPTFSELTKLLQCSSCTKIYVNHVKEDKYDNQCRQFKFLNFDNKIVERKCIFDENNSVKKLDVMCNKIQPLNDFVFYGDSKVLNKEYFSFTTGLTKDFCCANQTHFVEYIGKCSEFTINYLDELKFLKLKYKTPDCPVFNNRKYASYIKHSKKCVIIISVHENCRQHSEAVNCDTAKHSCNAIIRK